MMQKGEERRKKKRDVRREKTTQPHVFILATLEILNDNNLKKTHTHTHTHTWVCCVKI